MAGSLNSSASVMQAGPCSVEAASQVPFYDLCSLLEKISNTSGTDKKKKILSIFVSFWREAHRNLHGTSRTVEYCYHAPG